MSGLGSRSSGAHNNARASRRPFGRSAVCMQETRQSRRAPRFPGASFLDGGLDCAACGGEGGGAVSKLLFARAAADLAAKVMEPCRLDGVSEVRLEKPQPTTLRLWTEGAPPDRAEERGYPGTVARIAPCPARLVGARRPDSRWSVRRGEAATPTNITAGACRSIRISAGGGVKRPSWGLHQDDWRDRRVSSPESAPDSTSGAATSRAISIRCLLPVAIEMVEEPRREGVGTGDAAICMPIHRCSRVRPRPVLAADGALARPFCLRRAKLLARCRRLA